MPARDCLQRRISEGEGCTANIDLAWTDQTAVVVVVVVVCFIYTKCLWGDFAAGVRHAVGISGDRLNAISIVVNQLRCCNVVCGLCCATLVGTVDCCAFNMRICKVVWRCRWFAEHMKTQDTIICTYLYTYVCSYIGTSVCAFVSSCNSTYICAYIFM